MIRHDLTNPTFADKMLLQALSAVHELIQAQLGCIRRRRCRRLCVPEKPQWAAHAAAASSAAASSAGAGSAGAGSAGASAGSAEGTTGGRYQAVQDSGGGRINDAMPM